MLYWDLASVVAKVFSLLGIASVVGGIFSLFLARWLSIEANRRVRAYMLVGSTVGFLATVIFFLLQIGAINQLGPGGMLDWQMGQILMQSSLGYSTAIRLGSFFLAAFTVQMYLTSIDARESRYRLWVCHALFIVIIFTLASTFLLTGHVTSLGILAHLAIGLHVIAVFLWIGSLWPLHAFCEVGAHDTAAVESVMKEFGRLAIVIVFLLVSAGLFFLSELLDTWSEIYESPYGRGMLVKLATVAVLLLLAALNKFRLVPGLGSPSGLLALTRSIKIEMALACIILVTTSYLTIVVSI